MSLAETIGTANEAAATNTPPTPTVERQMASIRARLIARYRLAAVPGRPEELVSVPTPNQVALAGRYISLGYGCGTIRIRTHEGPRNRDWADHVDIQIKDGWHSQVYAFLDPHFKYKPLS